MNATMKSTMNATMNATMKSTGNKIDSPRYVNPYSILHQSDMNRLEKKQHFEKELEWQ